MPTTTLPGFLDAVHESQRLFKGLLDALAHPGQVYSLAVNVRAPMGLMPVCAAACLTLLDWETMVWLQPDLPAEVKDWLRFHTGCRFCENPAIADFAIVGNADAMPDLNGFKSGTAEDPEDSATLFLQVRDFALGQLQPLAGPGILGRVAIAPSLPESFWTQWQQSQLAYPQGIDCFLFTPQSVMGLPRSARLLLEE